MTVDSVGRWEHIRSRAVTTPELCERYERGKQTVLRMRKFLKQIDAERERSGLTKAEIAHRIGANPSVIRRLFSSGSGNPTLRTLLEMLDVLEVEIELKPNGKYRHPPPPRQSRRSKSALG
jgi:ribosome-binding protein aMBF1 (putative translation factor)